MDLLKFSPRNEVEHLHLDTSGQVVDACTDLYESLLERSHKTRDWKVEYDEAGLLVYNLPAPTGFVSFVGRCVIPAASCEIYLKVCHFLHSCLHLA